MTNVEPSPARLLDSAPKHKLSDQHRSRAVRSLLFVFPVIALLNHAVNAAPAIPYRPSADLLESSQTTAELGRGYDSEFEELLSGTCVETLDKWPDLPSGTATTGYIDFKEASSVSQLQSQLSIGIRARAGRGPWKASAAANFFKSAKRAAHSYFLTLDSSATFPQQVVPVQQFTLTRNAKALLEANQIVAFRRLCGDSFVYARTPGRRLIVTWESSTLDESETSSLQSTMSLAIKAFSANVDVRTALEKAYTEKKVKYYIIFAGLSESIPMSPIELVELAHSLNNKTTSSGASTVEVHHMRYEYLNDYPVQKLLPSSSAEAQLLWDLIALDDRRRALSEVSEALSSRDDRSSYGEVDESRLRDELALLDAAIKDLEVAISKCESERVGQNVSCDKYASKIKLPPLDRRIIRPIHTFPVNIDTGLPQSLDLVVRDQDSVLLGFRGDFKHRDHLPIQTWTTIGVGSPLHMFVLADFMHPERISCVVPRSSCYVPVGVEVSYRIGVSDGPPGQDDNQPGASPAQAFWYEPIYPIARCTYSGGGIHPDYCQGGE